MANRGLTHLAASALILASAVAAVAPAAPAHAETKLKLVLNWKYQGPQGLLFLAEDHGYFKAEGLSVTMDQGSGSGAAVPLVANGTYEAGFGDINALIELAARKPGDTPVAVFMMYNKPPFTVAVKADGPIKTPADLAGKALGGPANDGALKLFPVFCKTARIDCGGVTITNMQPNLREQMLMRGQVDGIFGYVNTIRFSSKLIGIDPEKAIRFINYGDYGIDLYSNAIIVSKSFAAKNPEAVKGFLRALNRSIKDGIKDPQAAIASVTKREPLIKSDVERARLDATLADEMSHSELARIGMGDVDDERLKKSIDILVAANGLPRTPVPAEIFDRSYLPAKSELLTTVK